jgi:hypothetical protein
MSEVSVLARSLRAVKPGEAPPPPKAPRAPRSLIEAINKGDYLAELRFTHKRIARTVADPETPPRELAALSRRQLEISKEIRTIELAAKEERESSAAEATPDAEWDPEAL